MENVNMCLLWKNGCISRFWTFQITTFQQFMCWYIVWTSCDSLIFCVIHICNMLRKESFKKKAFFYLPSFLVVLTVLTVIIELCWYPGCLFAVSPDNVEVRKQVQGNLHKELKAKQGQDTEVDVGQLGRKRLVGQISRRLRHFFPRVTEEFWLLWREDRMPLQITDEWSWVSLRELTGWLVQTKCSSGKNALQLPELFSN